MLHATPVWVCSAILQSDSKQPRNTYMPVATEYEIHLRRPHSHQQEFVSSTAKRKVIRAGRRGGKTTGAAILAVTEFLAGKRILYGAPTQEQLEAFWREVKAALAEPLDAGFLYKNESTHIIESPRTMNRIRAKTCWNADTLRGDSADLLILDEWQLMNEDAWGFVGAPMLLDNNGDAVFIYTPPSLHSKSITKAKDPRHAAKMFKAAEENTTGRWEAFHFTSYDNPHISEEALADIKLDMTALAIRQEIMAEDTEEVQGALWSRAMIEECRVKEAPELTRVVIPVDPPGGATECGIVPFGIGPCACKGDMQVHGFVIADYSIQASPDRWGANVLNAYDDHVADRVLGEVNFGGDMVESVVNAAAQARGISVSYRAVHASRGKAVRAEPVAALYEQGRIHHVGSFPILEEELCTWVPGESQWSPNRLDSLVWGATDTMVQNRRSGVRFIEYQ